MKFLAGFLFGLLVVAAGVSLSVGTSVASACDTNFWNLGCQFVQKVGWDELRLFG